MRLRCRELTHRLNQSGPADVDLRRKTLTALVARHGQGFWVEPPFYCDYGSNLTVGDRVFMNFNCVFIDVLPITVGDDVLFGPNVQVYTATHPLDWQTRRQWLEAGKPITVGSDVWVRRRGDAAAGRHRRPPAA